MPRDVSSRSQAIDAQVYQLIRMKGPLKFFQIHPQEADVTWREKDRSLQRLRKFGMIEYDTKRGWSLKG